MVKEFFGDHPWMLVVCKILLTIWITHIALLICKKVWARNPHNKEYLFRKFIFRIVQSLIYLLGVLYVIGQIPSLSTLMRTVLAGSGIVALGISLSAQESLNSLISGMFIALFKPFEVGDRVTLANSMITGIIEDITLRHTIVKTFTNTRIVVPNSTMNKEIIENSNLVDSRAAAFVDVSVAYESDIDKAMEIMAQVIGDHPFYWDIRPQEERETTPKVQVFVRELGASGISLRANMWTKTVNENFAACSDVRLQIKKAFDEAGIEIPYTKYKILYQEDAEPLE